MLIGTSYKPRQYIISSLSLPSPYNWYSFIFLFVACLSSSLQYPDRLQSKTKNAEMRSTFATVSLLFLLISVVSCGDERLQCRKDLDKISEDNPLVLISPSLFPPLSLLLSLSLSLSLSLFLCIVCITVQLRGVVHD